MPAALPRESPERKGQLGEARGVRGGCSPREASQAQPPEWAPPPPSESPGPGPGATRAHPALCPPLRGAPAPASASLTRGAPKLREPWGESPPAVDSPLPRPDCPSLRGAPGNAPPWPRRDHPPAPTPAGTRAPHLTPPAGPGPRPQPRSPQAAPATLDTGNSWVPDSGSPRPPSSVNSACFSTKWRRRSRAHVAAFPLPVLISSFAARSRREGPGTGQ